LSVTAISASIVIGTCVFIITRIAAKYAGALICAPYAIGAVTVIPVGFSTIFLNLMFPGEGGRAMSIQQGL